MSLRDALEKHKRWLVPVFLVLGLSALGYSVWSDRKSSISEAPISRAYFSDDEGKTYFEDDVSKAFPFPHNGKTAYRAYIYRCGPNGKPFVGAIGRQVQVAANPAPPTGAYKSDNSSNAVIEIRKLGTDKWVPIAGAEGMKLIQSLCPDGRPESILPGEE